MAQSQEVNLIAKALNEARKKMTFAVKGSENLFLNRVMQTFRVLLTQRPRLLVKMV